MDPVCFHLGPLKVHWYGVMMALGFLLGLANWVALGRKNGRDFQYCSDLLFWVMVAGIVGARIAYVLTDIGYFVANPAKIIRIDQGGIIFYGGFLGAAAAVILFARARRENLTELLDFVVTSLPAAHAVGRIGCFINGCCFGRLWNGPAAVTYPADTLPWYVQLDAGQIDRYAATSLPVHPVQLYEAVFNLVLYLVLVWVYRHRRANGMTLAAYLLLYPVGRFALEFLRGDDRGGALGLSTAQLVGIMLFCVGLVVLWMALRRDPARDSSQVVR